MVHRRGCLGNCGFSVCNNRLPIGLRCVGLQPGAFEIVEGPECGAAGAATADFE